MDRGTVRLHLGCGIVYRPGYVNIDLHDPSVSDLRADVFSLPFPPGSVSVMEAYHLIEHVDRAHATILLSHWYRLLRPGGTLVLETPDIARAFTAYRKADPDRKRTLLQWIYGVQGAGMGHRTGYDEETLTHLLTSIGFMGVTREEQQTHRYESGLRMACRKPGPGASPGGDRQTAEAMVNELVAEFLIRAYQTFPELRDSMELVPMDRWCFTRVREGLAEDRKATRYSPPPGHTGAMVHEGRAVHSHRPGGTDRTCLMGHSSHPDHRDPSTCPDPAAPPDSTIPPTPTAPPTPTIPPDPAAPPDSTAPHSRPRPPGPTAFLSPTTLSTFTFPPTGTTHPPPPILRVIADLAVCEPRLCLLLLDVLKLTGSGDGGRIGIPGDGTARAWIRSVLEHLVALRFHHRLFTLWERTRKNPGRSGEDMERFRRERSTLVLHLLAPAEPARTTLDSSLAYIATLPPAGDMQFFHPEAVRRRARILLNRGVGTWSRGNPRDARELFLSSAACDPDNPLVHWNLARVEALTGSGADAQGQSGSKPRAGTDPGVGTDAPSLAEPDTRAGPVSPAIRARYATSLDTALMAGAKDLIRVIEREMKAVMAQGSTAVPQEPVSEFVLNEGRS